MTTIAPSRPWRRASRKQYPEFMSETKDVTPSCPSCASEYTYPAGTLLACSMCGHQWPPDDAPTETSIDESAEIRDAVGNILHDGDTVTLIKSVKVTGTGGGSIKIGTKVPSIRLISDGVADHDIDARIPGFGRVQLKSSLVKRLS